jgi:hypothetical protein
MSLRIVGMVTRQCWVDIALLAGSALALVSPALAVEVTPERLINADHEPQNWLMNHRTYDGQRFSPLARINREELPESKRLARVTPRVSSDLWAASRRRWHHSLFISDRCRCESPPSR